jgi:hypothetical protein
LKQQALRKVDIAKWKSEPSVVDGLKKVYEVQGYEGIFKDEEGKLWDLRNKDMCPSRSNFMAKSIKDVSELLKKAYQAQLDVLKKEEPYDEVVQVTIINEISKKLEQLNKIYFNNK